MAVAGKVIFGTRTSSSGKTLIALSAKKIAEVPLVEVITYFVLSNEDIFFSKFLVNSHSLGKFLFNTSLIKLIVLLILMTGRAKIFNFFHSGDLRNFSFLI